MGLKSWRLSWAIALCLILLAGGWFGWRWWHRPPLPLPGPDQAEITRQQQAVDAKAAKRQDALIKALSESNRRLQADLARLKAEIAARHDAPLQEAKRQGPDALAKLASEWWRPGALAALKVQKGQP